LVFPQFDSLPATAGLNNTEAFRLSIRHALALLPALLAKGMDERPGTDYPDRFSALKDLPARGTIIRGFYGAQRDA